MTVTPADDLQLVLAMLSVIAKQPDLSDETRRLLDMAKERLSILTEPVLTSKHHDATVNTVDATTSDLARSRKRMRPRTRKHPAVAAFEAKGDTIATAAVKLGYHRNTVQAWLRDDEHGRGIPESAVAKAQKLYGIPRTAWARIIP